MIHMNRASVLIAVIVLSASAIGCDGHEVHDQRLNDERQKVGLRLMPSNFYKIVDNGRSTHWGDGVGWLNRPPPRYHGKVFLFDESHARLLEETDVYDSGKRFGPGSRSQEVLHITFSWKLHREGQQVWRYTHASQSGTHDISEADAHSLLTEWGLTR